MKNSYKAELRRMRRSFFYLIPATLFLIFSGIFIILFQLKTGYGDLLYSLEGFSFLIPLFLGLWLTLSTADMAGMSPKKRSSATRKNERHTFPERAGHPASREAFTRSFLGTYLADLTLFLIPMLLLCTFPLFLSLFGTLSLSSAYVSLFGLFLYGAFLISVFRFSFSFFSGRISVFVCGGALTLASLLWRVCASVRLFSAASYLGYLFGTEGFLHGRFSLSGTFFFVSGAALFLLLAVLLHQPIRHPLVHGIGTAAGAIVFLLLNAAFLLFPDRILHPDVTGKDTFSLSESTETLLKELDTDVTLSYVCTRGIRDADADLYTFFSRFAEQNPHIRLRLILPEEIPEHISSATTVENQSLIVSSGNRYRILPPSSLYHYYNSVLKADLSSDLYLSFLSAFFSYAESGSAEGLNSTLVSCGRTLYESAACTKAYFDGDSALSNAIRYVTSTLSTACYLKSETFETPDDAFLQSVASAGFDLIPISSLAEIPADCSLLILHAPKADPDAEETALLKKYLSSGGNLFLTTSHLTEKADFPNLSEVLENYGMGLENDAFLICEKDTAYLPAEAQESGYLFFAHVASGTYTGDFDGRFFVSAASPIRLLPDTLATVTPWIYSSEKANRQKEDGTTEETAETLVCGAIAKKENSTLIWLSSEDSVSEVADFLSEQSNYHLLKNGLSALAETDYREIRTEGKQIFSVSLTVTDGACALFSLLFLFLPVLLLALSAVLFRSDRT